MMKVVDKIIMMEKGIVVEERSYNESIRGKVEFACMLRGEAWEVDTRNKKRTSMMLMRNVPSIAIVVWVRSLGDPGYSGQASKHDADVEILSDSVELAT
jgi:ABC-type methionine transport system ATPase subunit